MDALDRAILDAVQDGFPVRARPYDELAERCGTSPADAERRVREMREDGVIRRLGAVIDSRALGMKTTLVAADVDPAEVETVAGRVDGFPEVTHSYLRAGPPDLWFTLVAASQDRIDEVMREVRALPGVRSADEFPATRVFKVGVRVRAGSSPPRHQGHQGSPGQRRVDSRGPEAADGKAVLSGGERAVLRELAVDLPSGAAPYAEVASRAGLGEEEVLAAIRDLVERGVIRRVAAIVRDRKLGYDANAMVAWRLPEGELERAGASAAAHAEISHCYARRITPGWPFNLYTMVHARSREELDAVVAAIAARIGDVERKVLTTRREFTKRRPSYAAVLGG